MPKKIHGIGKIVMKKALKGGISVEIDPTRTNRNLSNAQYKLDTAIMTSMKPYMPMDKGNFINSTSAMSAALAGTGQVVAGAPPQGRFLYEGNVMVDELTGSPWARKGAKKVLVSQYSGKTNVKNNRLQMSKAHNPDATDHWFNAAKKADLGKWVDVVKEEMKKT